MTEQPIIQIDNGIVTLAAGGLQTPSRLNFINQHSPVRVREIQGDWYIGRTSFFDGIKVCIRSKSIINHIQVVNY